MAELTPEFLAMGLVWLVAFLFSTTVHEASHALAAWKLGDPTAYLGGQVTLNPLPHVQREPIGMLAVPILSYLFTPGWMMGWASAPYDPWWADRHPRRAAWMALAGPASNLLLLTGTGLLIRLGTAAGFLAAPASVTFTHVVEGAAGGPGAVAPVLSILFTLNLLLLVFNLLPLPPLDGSGALPLVLPERVALRFQEFMRQPTWSLLGIFVAWKVIGEIFFPIFLFAVNLLYPGLRYR